MRKAMYLMGELDDADIHWLAKSGRLVRLAPGQSLVREGVPVDALFVVLDGEFAVRTGSARLATLLAGEVVGEISFVDSRPPMAHVEAVGSARVLAIDRQVLRQKLSQDLSFATHFYRALAVFLADRLRTTTARLGYGSPSQDAAAPADLGEDLLETVSLGSQRFDRLLRQVEEA